MAMLRPFVSIFQVRIARCGARQYRANVFPSKHQEETDPSELRRGMKRREAARWWLREAFSRIVPIRFQLGNSLGLPFEGVKQEDP